MTKDIIQFSHPQFGTVRGWRDEDGEAWLMGSDVARRLGYSNPPKAIRDHVDEEDKTLNETFIVNGHHPIFINESGTYALVLSSKLPAARAFKSWVTREVLPSIRKTGGYIKADAQDSQETIRQRAIEALGEALRRKDSLLLQKDRQIMQLLPKAEYNDEVLCSVSCRTTTQVAKDLGMTAQELNRQLCQAGIQYYQGGRYYLYADYARQGFAKSRTYTRTDSTGCIHSCTYLVWTERGRKFLHEWTDSLYEL